MSERDGLRQRVGALLEAEYPREWVAEDVTGQQYSEWYREKAVAVLAEIEREHVIVERAWFEHHHSGAVILQLTPGRCPSLPNAEGRPAMGGPRARPWWQPGMRLQYSGLRQSPLLLQFIERVVIGPVEKPADSQDEDR